jgi:hypothetical protein
MVSCPIFSKGTEMADKPKTMTVPDAGRIYYGLSRNGLAAKRGDWGARSRLSPFRRTASLPNATTGGFVSAR